MPDIECLIPKKIPEYTAFGNHSKIYQIINSRRWAPTFITGLSGCGKTTTVEQVCCDLGRECYTISITVETDEDDLLGGFRLINGETRFVKGPVVEAMERGAICLLDEVDLASFKIMCLQSPLSGKSIFLKKIGERIDPKPGFNIFATANTKGQGCSSGKFVGTNVLNEAFLDRFDFTYEQTYPEMETEKNILTKYLASQNIRDPKFVACLVQWAHQIRELFRIEEVSEVVSTRRLIQIVNGYSIFGDKVEAIKDATSRFSTDIQKQFLDFYGKIDDTVTVDGVAQKVKPAVIDSVDISANEIPF